MAVIVLSKSPFTNWDGVKVEDVELEIVVIVVLIIYDYYDQDFCDDIKRLNNMEFKTQMFEGSYGFLMCNNICYCKNDDFTTKLYSIMINLQIFELIPNSFIKISSSSFSSIYFNP